MIDRLHLDRDLQGETRPMRRRQEAEQDDIDNGVGISAGDIQMVASGDALPRVPSDASEQSDVVCRICQMTEDESGEPLKITNCSCKGSMQISHRSCLIEWVRRRRSDRCEICTAKFDGVSPPLSREPSGDRNILATLPDIYLREQFRFFDMSSTKRAILGCALVFLVVMTAIMAVLTSSTGQDYNQASSSPWSVSETVEEAYIVFALCLSFLFLCGTLSIVVLLGWVVIEVYVAVRNHRLNRTLRQISLAIL